MGSLLALDSASLYYRAYFGVPESMTAPNGMPVNAVRGFLDMVARLSTDRGPTAIACAWDEDWRPAFRVAAVPSYKTHRVQEELSQAPDVEQTPDTLSPQIDLIYEVLAELGLEPIGADGYEADDVLGTLAHRLGTEHLPLDALDVVTGDRDLFQLVDDSRNIRVIYTARGVSNYDLVTESWVSNKYGIPGRSYGAFAALRGDTSDGLPGVPGIGEKTAAKIINDFPSLDAIRAAMNDATSGLAAPVRAKLSAAADYLSVIEPVVFVATDCEIDIGHVLSRPEPNSKALENLGKKWGISTSINRVLAALENL